MQQTLSNGTSAGEPEQAAGEPADFGAMRAMLREPGNDSTVDYILRRLLTEVEQMHARLDRYEASRNSGAGASG